MRIETSCFDLRWVILAVASLLWLVPTVSAQDEASVPTEVSRSELNNPEAPGGSETTIDIEFGAESNRADHSDPPQFSPIEQLFKNPAISSGLVSGADAINRSVESLMDSIFYSLLDHERNLRISDESWFSAQLKRDVYSTPSGAYVVVDRVALGPKFFKELWRVQDVPVSLGVDNSVDVMQIYLRTDGMRLAEQEELPLWRRIINNWFGLVPALALILPPSFNQNELYDPIRQLETPFVFPTSVEGFYNMPVGSIRSYALGGGVQLPFDFSGGLPAASRRELERIGRYAPTLPYTLFKRGEHRINVLRRSEHSAWVGLTDLDRTGHSISPNLGSKVHVLRGALAAQVLDWKWVWAGVPLPVFPIDINFEHAMVDLFDQVYEYDLRNPVAKEAYLAAVKGDFVPSRLRYLDAKEKGQNTGVTFHFARLQDRQEVVSHNGPNVVVARSQREADLSTGEIEITDEDGKFYVLESHHEIADKSWDVLVGEEESRYQQIVEMQVRRVLNKENPDDVDDYSYAFEAGDNPIGLTFSLSIQDRYVDVQEYRQFLDDLRYFTDIPLEDVPHLELQDAERLLRYRQEGVFVSPQDSVALIHVPPTYIGRFGAQASVYFSTESLNYVLEQSEANKWAAFAQAYGVEPELWADADQRNSFSQQLRWFEAFFLYPTRLLNVRIAAADALKEAAEGILALARIKALELPAEKLEAFYELLDTDYPARLVRALLNMSETERISRRVSFSAQAKGSAPDSVKEKYRQLNGLVKHAGPPFPAAGRYQRARQKLAAFYLDQPREAANRPGLSKILVTTRTLPDSIRNLMEDPDFVGPDRPYDRKAPQIYVTLRAVQVQPDIPLKLYVRVEEAGRIKLGKLELAQNVTELRPLPTPSNSNHTALTYEFYLSGPMSPLSNFAYDRAVASGRPLRVTLAISQDGAIWSNEQSFEFQFENGRLVPPRDE